MSWKNSLQNNVADKSKRYTYSYVPGKWLKHLLFKLLKLCSFIIVSVDKFSAL